MLMMLMKMKEYFVVVVQQKIDHHVYKHVVFVMEIHRFDNDVDLLMVDDLNLVLLYENDCDLKLSDGRTVLTGV